MTRIRRRDLVLGSSAALGTVAAGLTARAQNSASAADFFKGKTMRVLIGTTPGAGYDLIARLVAIHLPKHIPGNPQMNAENMPGAGSLTMMNYLYTRAPQDGTVFGLPLNGVILEPSLQLMSRGGGTVAFDLAKMNWLGSPSQEPQLLWVLTTSSSATSYQDTKGLRVGASSVSADNFVISTLANKLLGTDLKIVGGYAGTNETFLAADRGEVDGGCTSFSAIVVGRPAWVNEKKIRVLIQFGSERLKELPDVPTGIELAPNDLAKQMLSLMSQKFTIAYPFVAPPGIPPERAAVLQQAFDALFKDPDFEKDMGKAGLTLRPTSGPEVARKIAIIGSAPDTVVSELKRQLSI